jgi:DNA-binding FadR family transcriptional regulator
LSGSTFRAEENVAMPTRFFELVLEASHNPELAALCRDREGLRVVMDRYGLSEAERNLVLKAAVPAGGSEDIVKAYRKADDIVKAYRKADEIVKAYRKVESAAVRSSPSI